MSGLGTDYTNNINAPSLITGSYVLPGTVTVGEVKPNWVRVEGSDGTTALAVNVGAATGLGTVGEWIRYSYVLDSSTLQDLADTRLANNVETFAAQVEVAQDAHWRPWADYWPGDVIYCDLADQGLPVGYYRVESIAARFTNEGEGLRYVVTVGRALIAEDAAVATKLAAILEAGLIDLETGLVTATESGQASTTIIITADDIPAHTHLWADITDPPAPGGDLAGPSLDAATVTRVQGREFGATPAPIDGNIIVWNETNEVAEWRTYPGVAALEGPEYIDVVTTTAAPSGNTTTSATVPAGVELDDLIVVHAVSRTGYMDRAGPEASGWTEVWDKAITQSSGTSDASGSTGEVSQVWWKYATDSEPATWDWDFISTNASFDQYTVSYMVFRRGQVDGFVYDSSNSITTPTQTVVASDIVLSISAAILDSQDDYASGNGQPAGTLNVFSSGPNANARDSGASAVYEVILEDGTSTARTFEAADGSWSTPTNWKGTGAVRIGWRSVLGAGGGGGGAVAYVPITIGGDLSVGSGVLRLPVLSAGTINAVRVMLADAPTGQSAIFDVNVNGTTIYTTQGNRPTVTAGSNDSGVGTAPDVTSVLPGDYFTVDVDQVGSTLTGGNAVVVIEIASV